MMKSVEFYSRKNAPAIVMMILSGLLMSCGKDKSSTSTSTASEMASTQQINYVVLGDPMEVVKNSKLDPSTEKLSTLLNSDETLRNEFALISIVSFTERLEINNNKDSKKSVEEGEEAETIDVSRPTQFLSYSAIQSVAGEFQLNLTNEAIKQFGENTITSISISPAIDTVGSRTVRLTVGSESIEARLLHVSVRGDNAFSLLFYGSDEEGGGGLVSFTFSRVREFALLPSSIGEEPYLFGPGVRIQLEGDKFEVGLCGTATYAHFAGLYSLKSALYEWQSAIPAEIPLSSKYYADGSYPPFSDLNVRCIYYIKNLYVMDPNGNYLTAGETRPQFDFFSGKIIDSDIFFYQNELNRRGPYENYVDSCTLIHELGHLFGLSHEFSGVESIMSYQNVPKSCRPNQKDLSAMKDLYKK